MTETPRTWSTGRRALAAALALGGTWLTLRALNRATRRVSGSSMEPTFADGDLVLTLPASIRTPREGDVVTVHDPRDHERVAVKRVATTEDGWASLPDGPGQVPGDHIAVRGDQPWSSTDSRTYGPVPIDRVDRYVVARLWPPRLVW